MITHPLPKHYSFSTPSEESRAQQKEQTPFLRTYLVVQWLRLCIPNAGDLGSVPGQELDLTCHS